MHRIRKTRFPLSPSRVQSSLTPLLPKGLGLLPEVVDVRIVVLVIFDVGKHRKSV